MKAEKALVDNLKQVYLFESFDQAQMDKVLANARTVNLNPKQILFECGDPAERFYVVGKGCIKLFFVSENGDEKVMEIMQRNRSFAEAIMFMEKHVYPINAQAMEKTELFSFDMHTYRNILKDSTTTCFQIMAEMTRRLHQRIDEINNLTLHNATFRLVTFLLEHIPEQVVEFPQIHLDIPKSIIASRLSIQPETFSRILARLTKQGLISVDGNNIVLTDVQGLRDLL